MPTKVTKENYVIYATFTTENFNDMIEKSHWNKRILMQKKFLGSKEKLQVYVHTKYRKLFSVACIHRLTSTLIQFFLRSNLHLEKDIICSIDH